MSEPTPEVRRLAEERRRARAAKEYARADELRAQIEQAGFTVRDTADGFTLEPHARVTTVDPRAIPDALGAPAAKRVSLHLLYEGFPDDLKRFLDAITSTCDVSDDEIVIVDNASGEAEVIADIASRCEGARVVHLDREVGWAEARNAGLKTSAGRAIALADLSVEAQGDILTPLASALDDATVGVVGPWGLVSSDMRSWERDAGPEVDAIEGYLLATRREVLARGLIHHRFRWYRNADIDLSFQVRALGLSARVVPVSMRVHEHRAWEAVPAAERDKRSRRNHYIFFDRWKDRRDLLTRPG